MSFRRDSKKIFAPLEPIDPEKEERPLFSFDVETTTDGDPENEEKFFPSRFVFGTLYDGRKYYDFTSRRKMAEFMCHLRWAGWTGFATNAEFDLNAIFVEPTWPLYRNYYGGVFKSARIELGRTPRSGRRKKRRGDDKEGSRKKTRNVVTILDTMQHCRGSVAALGEMVGLPKLEMPDIANASVDRVRRYCHRDARITWEAMHRRQQVYLKEGCKMGASTASTTMDLFRRRFMDDRHMFKKVPPEMLNNFRLSYHGARTEAFVHGWRGMDHGDERGVTFGDVNGMYVSCMLDTRLPILHKPRGTRNSREGCRMIDKDVEGVARVRMQVPESMHYPPLPARVGQKLYFPTGTWDGVYPLNEIRHAIACGCKLLSVKWIIYYHETGKLFHDFAAWVYEQRMQAVDPVENLTFKDCGNAVYGKWAMAGESIMIGPNWWAPPGGKTYGDFVQTRETKATGAIYTNYIWASYITAAARIRIHEELVLHRGLYTDTDSVATFDAILPNKELGAMAFDGYAMNVQFLAPKTYLCHGKDGVVKIRTKGIPARGVGLAEIEGADGITVVEAIPYRDLTSIPQEFLFQTAMRFRQGVVRNIPPNSWGMVYKTLKLREEDRKRVHLEGGETRPFDARELKAKIGYWEKDLNVPWYTLAHQPMAVAGTISPKRVKSREAV